MRRFSHRKVSLRPGYIVNCEFSALGGVSYRREQLGEETLGERGLQREHNTKVTIDNVELLKESKAIIGAAYYVMDRACVNTPVGRLPLAAQVVTFPLAFPKAKRDFTLWRKSVSAALHSLFPAVGEIMLLELLRVKQITRMVHTMSPDSLAKMAEQLEARVRAGEANSAPDAPAPAQARPNPNLC